MNNRVQVALSKLPQDVQKQGVTVKKKSSALLGVIAVYSPKGTLDPLFISNYATINLLDQIKATPGVGDASLWGPQDYAMRAWVHTDQLTGLGLTTAISSTPFKPRTCRPPWGALVPARSPTIKGCSSTSRRRAVSIPPPFRDRDPHQSDGFGRLKDVGLVSSLARDLDREPRSMASRGSARVSSPARTRLRR